MKNSNVRRAFLVVVALALPLFGAEAPKTPASGPAVKFSPDPMDFGYIAPGNYVLITLTVTNTGSSDLIITSDKVYPVSEIFEEEVGGDGCAGTTVSPGNSCSVGLYFTPLYPATRDLGAYFVIFDNAAGGYQKVLMYGRSSPKTGAEEDPTNQ